LALLLSAGAARAEQTRPPEFVGVRVGLGGCYKAGLWTPVEVTLRGGSQSCCGRVRLTVPDGDGVASRVVTPPDEPVSVLPGKETKVGLNVRFGRVCGTLAAEFEVEGRVVAEKIFTARADAGPDGFREAVETRPLIVCLGPVAKTVEEATTFSGLEPQRRPLVARLDDLERLPAKWYGYEGVDALVLSTSKPELYRRLAPGSPQVEALDQWVRMGGKLVLCGGAHFAEVLGRHSAWSRFAPGRLQQMAALRQTGGLESYADSTLSILSPGGDRPPLAVPWLDEVEGVVEARELDLPLVIRTARGLGQVVFLAAELDEPPLSRWSDAARLVARLLGLPTERVSSANERPGGVTLGYSDMAGQLRSALDQFSGVRLVPFWIVAALVIVYILLIGPGDYFFLRKVVGRMQWTWLTFPLLVLLLSVAAYLLAHGLKGNRIGVNQVDLVDVDVASGQIRGTSWMNVFSPRTESFNLSARPWLPSGERGRRAAIPMAWLGLPGKGLGGMDPQTTDTVGWNSGYEFSPDLAAVRGLPIRVWSSRSLTARWNERVPAAGLESDLAEEEQLLVGTITNNLKFPLTKCVLAYDRWAYELETLRPGQSVALAAMARSELQTRWTGLKLVMESGTGGRGPERSGFREEAAVYDRTSTDALYVLRMMMFFEAAGGQRYTGLTNDYQRFVDLSDLLKTGRAILVAEAPDGEVEGSRSRGGAELCRDGQSIAQGPNDRHAVLYRFVLPVKKRN
jgi:hypothetical protein